MTEQGNLETILRTGQIVANQYRVDGLIAKGGMAAVWAGVNQHTGKRVALKVILRSFAANRDAVELFRREALAASKINHPNVVNIFDVIDHEDKTCIVMELLDGQTLGSYLARAGPLSAEETVALLLPAMRGVAAANAQGVIHRDLKPANIFLCSGPDGQLLTTKVLDFGISVMMRLVGETPEAAAPLAMFGTPSYMAPEAIELSPDLDGRADVYGFGVLFFEALTGKLPFPGPAGMELLRRILTDSAPVVTLYRSDLPSGVVDLIACALAKKPGDRFADMEHLVRATENLLLILPPAPRVLRLVADVASALPTESNSGAAVPMVQAPFEPERPRLPNLGATRALYSLARAPPRATDGPGPVHGRRPAMARPGIRARREARSPGRYRRLVPRRFVIGAGFVVLLLVTGWVTVPASSSDTRVGQRQSPSSSETAALAGGPLVLPIPGPSSPVPSPIATADNPGEPSVIVPAGDERALPPTPETKSADLAAMGTTQSSGQRGAPNPLKRVLRGSAMPRQPPAVAFPQQRTDPRAGRLSPSDF